MAPRGERTRRDRTAIRDEILAPLEDNYLKFQTQANMRFGAAAGNMCRELLYCDDKGNDTRGWTYMTKEDDYQRTGLSPKAQDGGRKRLEKAGGLEVDRRPRRNKDGRITHPSRVLHYRLNLSQILTCMRTDPDVLKGQLERADRSPRESRSVDGNKPIGSIKEADGDPSARRSGERSAPKRTFEHAVTGAPYTEGTSEVTAEATQEGASRGTTQESSEETTRGCGPLHEDRTVPGRIARERVETGRKRSSNNPKILNDVIEMIEGAGPGKSEDEHLDAPCKRNAIPLEYREDYRPYVAAALESMRTTKKAG